MHAPVSSLHLSCIQCSLPFLLELVSSCQVLLLECHLLSVLVDVLDVVKLLLSWFQVWSFTLQLGLLKLVAGRLETLAAFDTAGRMRGDRDLLLLGAGII